MKKIALVTLWVYLSIVAVRGASANELVLEAGFNLVSFTNELDTALSSHSLVSVFGPNLLSVSRINVAAQELETTTFSGAPAGDDFPITNDEAYFVEMAVGGTIELEGSRARISVDLEPGVNLIGLGPVLPNFRAYDLLQLIGLPDVVTSVQRLDADTGRYVTATQSPQGFTGENFKVGAGEGYLVSVSQSVSSIQAPFVFFLRASEKFLISREVLSGGGGFSESANFQLFSVIGQSTPVGVMTSSSFELSGGFLSNSGGSE